MSFTPAYGWRQPHLPYRGRLYGAPPGGWYPKLDIDLRPYAPPIRSQLTLGSCVAFALTSAAEYAIDRAARDGLWVGPPETRGPLSPLWLYYRIREDYGLTSRDTGSSAVDGMARMRDSGLIPEALWPYRIGDFDLRPPQGIYAAALRLRAINTEQLSFDESSVLASLAAGFPVVFGITTYPSFASAQAGRVQIPGDNESPVGGHMLLGLGVYTEHGERRVRFANSWGKSWADGGYGSIPMSYLTNPGLCGELLTIRVMGAL